jgi:hypothetical protein
MIWEEITTQVLDAFTEKVAQAQIQGRELADKFQTLAGAVEGACKS